MIKQCFKCLSVLPLTLFYRHKEMADGHLGKCKGCTKRDAYTRYVSKFEVIQQYERARTQRPKRKAYARRHQVEWRKRNPHKYSAQRQVNNALRDGKLKREDCLVCGKKKAHAHHEDYSKPLEVVWLCPKHHQERHRVLARLGWTGL